MNPIYRTQILGYLVGEVAPTLFIAAIIASCIGQLVRFLISANKRKDGSHFDFWYMVRDNTQRAFTGLILSIVFIRFYTAAVSGFVTLNGENINMTAAAAYMLVAFATGLISDYLEIWFRKKRRQYIKKLQDDSDKES